MNSRERMLTAFKHQEPDRVPTAELHIMSPISSELLGRQAITGEGGWTIWTQKEMVRNGNRDEFVERMKKDTVDAFVNAGLDNVLVELDPPKRTNKIIDNISDCVWRETNPDTGMWAEFKYEEESDIALEINSTEKVDEAEGVARHLDAIESSGYVIDSGCFESARYTVDKVGKEKFIMAKVPNLFPSGRSWYTYYMEMVYTEPELAQRLSDVYLKYATAVVKEYILIGIDCVMIASDWAYNNGPIFSPQIVKEFFVPQIRSIAKLCHESGVKVLKHTDGNIWKIADDFFDMGIDAYQGMEPNVGMKIKDVKEKYGERITLMGNIDCAYTLPFGSQKEIIAETRECIKEGAKGGGYILSSANSIANPIPLSSFMTMVETAHKYGVYPIEY